MVYAILANQEKCLCFTQHNLCITKIGVHTAMYSPRISLVFTGPSTPNTFLGCIKVYNYLLLGTRRPFPVFISNGVKTGEQVLMLLFIVSDYPSIGFSFKT